jgi:hypothetical protein
MITTMIKYNCHSAPVPSAMITVMRRARTALLGIGIMGLTAAALGSVAEPKVTSDRTVDTSSIEAIVQALLQDRKTPQEKALALFEFQRRMVYHVNADMYGDHRDFMKSYNVYGCNLCGSQATTAVELARKMGCFEDARPVSVPGHTIYELKYDGKWHTFDTMMNFYVFTDQGKTNIANLDELKANPGLATRAVAEGRACPGYLHCGDAISTFTGGRQSVLDYKHAPSTNQMKYTLLRGESWTRHFTPQFDAPAWCRPIGGTGPYHGCGGRDDQDSVGFPYWEPYLIRQFGRVSRSYRYYGTGYWEYAPDLSSTAGIADAQSSGLHVAEGVLRAAAAGQTAEFIYTLAHCPWLLVNGRVTAKVVKGAPDDVVRISAGPDTKNMKEVWSANGSGEQAVEADLFASALNKKAWTCVVKVEIKAADPAKTGLSQFHVKLGFLHNSPASPVLLSGENRIRVECKPDGLKDASLALTYAWFDVEKDGADQPTYQAAAQTKTETISKSPTEFTIKTPATKHFPKMDFIRLECK